MPGMAENESVIASAADQKLVYIKLKSPIKQCEEGCNRKCHGADHIHSMRYDATGSTKAQEDRSLPGISCSCRCK